MKYTRKSFGLIALLAVGNFAAGSLKQASYLYPKNGENLVAPVAPSVDNNVYLNITSIGLYQGHKGVAAEGSNLEYAVVLKLDIGANLPDSSKITSSSQQVSFLKWCYYVSGGMLNYTDKVIENVNLYQAVFKYNGDYTFPSTDIKPTSSIIPPSTPVTPPSTPVTPPPTPVTPPSTPVTPPSTPVTPPSTPVTPPSTPPVPPSTPILPTTPSVLPSTPLPPVINERTYYFVDSAWWNSENGDPFYFLFGSQGEFAPYPGQLMTWVKEGNDASNIFKKTWTFTVDINKFDTLVISRMGKNEAGNHVYWDAKTEDIKLTEEFNTIFLWDEPMWNGKLSKTSTSMIDYTV